MPDSILSTAERRLIHELQSRGIRFLVVGMSGALLQGARGATEDIDLWFEDVTDERIGDAVRSAGGVWISGAFGLGPPRIGGDEFGDRFDVVTYMSGLSSFDEEYRDAVFEMVDDLRLPVLPLRRILVSKRAANRPKDKALITSLEDTLAVLEDGYGAEKTERKA